MPFMHKLSRRLAISRIWWVVVVALPMLSCDAATTDPGSNAADIVAMIVYPTNVSLTPNSTRQFRAYGVRSGGDSLVLPVRWGATGGRIEANGTFTADTVPGQFTVAATHVEMDWLTDTSLVHVEGGASPPPPAEIASVDLTPDSGSVAVGGTVQLQAEIKDQNGNPMTGKVVAWGSADASIASVDSKGVVRGIKAGRTAITAQAGSKSDAAVITVSTVRAASVTVTPNAASVQAGNTVQLTATVKDSAGNILADRIVSWSSPNTAVATVNANGLVRAVAAGSVTIAAMADGGSAQATSSVAAASADFSLYLEAEASALVAPMLQMDSAGVTFVRSATANSGTATFTFSVPASGTYYVWGRILGPGPDEDSYFVTVDGGGEDVYDAAENRWSTAWQWTVVNGRGTTGEPLTLNPRPFQLTAGSHSLTFRGREANAELDRIFITDNAAAVPSDNGTSVSGSASVTVTPAPAAPVASVTVAPAAATVAVGGTQQLTATLKDASGNTLTGRTVTWSSSSSAVATVNSGGLVTGVANGSATISATSEGQSGSSVVTVQTVAPPPVATVSVSPASATLGVGATQQFTATLRDASGNMLTGRTVTWSSSNVGIASVGMSGLVTGAAVGSATITAASEGQSGSATVTVQAAVARAGYYVAPNGSSSGNGSSSSPWNLATALAHPSAVRPGDTIWVRGGTYTGPFTSTLRGTSSAPIIVRQFPGERVTLQSPIDAVATLYVQGAYTWYWGFELVHTNPNTDRVAGIYSDAPGSRFINLVVHDHSGVGIGVWVPAPDAEVYGCIIYNNGFYGSTPTTHGHGIYAQNETGTKRLEDNIVFNQYGWGFHIYGGNAALNNFHLEGNVSFNNGTLTGQGQPNIFAGGGRPVNNFTMLGNMTYQSPSTNGPTWIGYPLSGELNTNGVVRNNYLVGGAPAIRLVRWSQLTFENNVIHARSSSDILFDQLGSSSGYQWSSQTYYGNQSAKQWTWQGNSYTFSEWRQATGMGASDTYAGTRPSGTVVFVRPNRYEPGRGHVIVYNWQLAGTATVDLSQILNPGDTYEIRNVQNYYGTPMVTGTYTGGTVTVPMAGIQPPSPLGGWRFPSVSAPVTGPEFNAFVVLRTSS